MIYYLEYFVLLNVKINIKINPNMFPIFSYQKPGQHLKFGLIFVVVIRILLNFCSLILTSYKTSI